MEQLENIKTVGLSGRPNNIFRGNLDKFLSIRHEFLNNYY